MKFTERKIGIYLMLLSALVFSSAGLFTKGVDAGAWDIIFWRGLFAAIFTVFFIFLRNTLHREFIQMGKTGWFAAILGASGTAAFIPAFKLTSIANVALIYAATPMLAAAIAWVWLKERMTDATLLGCTLAVVGVVVIVQGNTGASNLNGNLLALWMTIAIALLMVIYRSNPNLPSAGPSTVSSLVLLPFGFLYGNPFQNPLPEIFIMAAFGAVFAIASITMVEGAKRLPSGETALLSALESPFAPVLAWLFFREVPVLATILGGGLILIGVLASQLYSMHSEGS